MSATTSPLHAAHQHAANAEDFMNQGLLIPAAEEHAKAAEAFLQCEEKSNDANTKRTLRMLYSEHIKAGRELERRITKLREENKDPTLPQKVPLTQKRAEHNSSAAGGRSHTPHPTPSPPLPSSSSLRLMDSQNNVDESFMVLGQRVRDTTSPLNTTQPAPCSCAKQKSDPGDAFNNFWRIMEGMLDNLSQPVAFTTAPLGTEPSSSMKRGVQRDGSSGSENEREAPLVPKFSQKLGADGRSKSRRDVVLEETDEEVFVDEGEELSESFCLIPPESEPAISILKQENTSLREKIEEMQRRLGDAEHILQVRKEQDQLLRDSIVMARHQAQKAMGASLVLPRTSGQQPTIDLGALNINIPPVPTPMAALNAGRDREAQLLRRMRDLEEELRLTRVENDKQKVMIARFRERWEKLKESAKRKKDAKAAAEATKAGARERIEEEPEAEQESDEGNRA